MHSDDTSRQRAPHRRHVRTVVGRLLLLALLLYVPYYALFTLFPAHFSLLGEVTWRYPQAVLTGDVKIGKPKTLIVGDSTIALAVVPTRLPRTIALASNGASSIETFLTIERYLKKHPKPDCIVLGYTYVDNHDFLRKRFWDFPVAFDFFDFSQLLALYDESERMGGFPATSYSWAGFVARALLIRAKLLPHNLFLFQTRVFALNSTERFQRQLDTMIRDKGTLTTRRFPLAENDWWADYITTPFQPDPMLDLYLRKTVSLTETHGIKLLYVHPPIHPDIRTEAREHLDQLFAHMQDIVAIADNAMLITEMPEYPATLFRDEFHLNRKGAVRYTSEFASILRCKQ